MTLSRYLPKASLLAAALAFVSCTATAAPLPGGASSLVETYDDWSVVCQMQANAPSCLVRQVQTNNQTKQTVLAVEIGKSADGKFRGTLVLPLGLALPQGAQLKIDDAALGNTLPFSTCLPQGCVVPLAFEADTIAKLRAGKALNVTVSAASPAQPLALAVSLKGLAGALNRIADLTK
ncbi:MULTISPECIES: invasion associated locus B family protein [unclassified Neorhizobium]|uniref:invasion associated locus B family protein n=1 Tax=unclassified Neorhizobium TaxID=2629175 RepID=UPI001FF273F6|nr:MULTISPECIES: invasion associated locus B family protein [unclassified Neorhizobium]MCJ9669945.1 invasion associated locus B family protein [Neorhizobium sp. SHOUNA12B]MCJ9744762.1 invasion associated locus B family protein [Neorhizobium sp. SHOUNA12A]